MQKQISQLLYICAGSLTLFGALALFYQFYYAPYIFSVGAGLFIYLQFVHALKFRGAEMRQQRLARIGFISSLFLAVAAYLMFTDSNLWVVAVLIYALISFYLSFRGN